MGLRGTQVMHLVSDPWIHVAFNVLRKYPYYHYFTKKVMLQQQTFLTACPHRGRKAGIHTV